jgi:GT2 family glycosyltransferase
MREKHSAVILNYNDYSSCEKLIRQIVEYRCIDSVVVVDNCSQDGSGEKLKKLAGESEKIHYIAAEKNGGYSRGNNLGCFYAADELGAEYITIVNPDVCFSEKAMEMVLTAFRRDRSGKLGAAAPYMRCRSDVDLPSAWRQPNYVDCILSELIIARRLIGDRTRYPLAIMNKKAVKVDVLAGSMFTVRALAFREVGGFDENTFLSYEENILAKRLRENGYFSLLLPCVQYDHFHSVSIDRTYKSVRAKFRLAYKSRKYYVKNCLGANWPELLLLYIAYIIGTNDYIIADKLRKFIKRRREKS